MGQKTLLARDSHDIRYDPIHDEIFLTNSPAQAILVFRGKANGDEAPIRVIQGPHTQLVGSSEAVSLMDRIDIDPIHNEITIPSGDKILVFPREANGDVAPLRVIHGPDTQLQVASAMAVDPVHNLIIVANNTGPAEVIRRWEPVGEGVIAPRRMWNPIPAALYIFNRTDNANVKPRAIIKGPKVNLFRVDQMQVYSPKSLVFVTDPVHHVIAVWNVDDSGDVPPRWTLGGPKSTLLTPRGVALDPLHKEVFVGDLTLNAVLTFYWPEVF